MKTPYDVLGVTRNASAEAIRAAFRKAAKAHHPDHNAGDPTAEPQLRLIIAAYNMLRNPRERADCDQYLRTIRRERVRHLAAAAVAGLVGLGIVALVLPTTQQAFGSSYATHIVAARANQPASQQVAADDSGGRQDGDGGRGNDGDRAA